MGYPKQVYDRAWEALTRQREEARALTRTRHEEIGRRLPEISAIEREMAVLAASVAKIIVASPNKAEEMTLQLGKNSLALQEQRKALLEKTGFPADYLEPQYGCANCRDTGYRGPQMCGCMRARGTTPEASTGLSG